MSFDTLKINELKKVADSFGIELPEKATKQSLILSLQDEGITWDMYAKFSGAEKQEIKVEDQPKKKVKLDKANTILVRMDRQNPSYSTHGYVFTQQHPFIAMSEDEAQLIFDTEIGFRPATPREAQDFYN
jgi:hypothetical protein